MRLCCLKRVTLLNKIDLPISGVSLPPFKHSSGSESIHDLFYFSAELGLQHLLMLILFIVAVDLIHKLSVVVNDRYFSDLLK